MHFQTRLVNGYYKHKAPVAQKLGRAIHIGQISIQWISIWETNCSIHWIEIYGLDSAIYLLNKRGQDFL